MTSTARLPIPGRRDRSTNGEGIEGGTMLCCFFCVLFFVFVFVFWATKTYIFSHCLCFALLSGRSFGILSLVPLPIARYKQKLEIPNRSRERHTLTSGVVQFPKNPLRTTHCVVICVVDFLAATQKIENSYAFFFQIKKCLLSHRMLLHRSTAIIPFGLSMSIG